MFVLCANAVVFVCVSVYVYLCVCACFVALMDAVDSSNADMCLCMCGLCFADL